MLAPAQGAGLDLPAATAGEPRPADASLAIEQDDVEGDRGKRHATMQPLLRVVEDLEAELFQAESRRHTAEVGLVPLLAEALLLLHIFTTELPSTR